jgi:hypothetical protein
MGAGGSVQRTDDEMKTFITALISGWIEEHAQASKIKCDLSENSLEISDELSEKLAAKVASVERRDNRIHRVYCYMMYLLDRPVPTIDDKFLNDCPVRVTNYEEGGGPYGVSLQYLFHFIDKYNISETMTTAEVVRDIIIPETVDSKQTFLEAKICPYQYYWSDLRLDHRRYLPTSRIVSSFDTFAFVSHAWAIPFRTLVSSVQKSCLDKWNEMIQFFILYSSQANLVEEYDDRVFLWIDIFCKNQHLPSPAMEEFYRAIETPKLVIAVLYPSIRPIAVNRVWCLFELFTAIRLNVPLQLCSPDESLYHEVVQIYLAQLADAAPPPADNPNTQKHAVRTQHNPLRFKLLGAAKIVEFLKQVLSVDVANAQATMPDDIGLILGLIKQHVGVDEMNQTIYNYLAENIITLDYHHLGDFAPACYGEDTLVTLKGGKQIPICQVKRGDAVLIDQTLDSKSQYGVVELLTCDVIESGELAMCCTREGVYMTPDHPIFTTRCCSPLDSKEVPCYEWILPKQIYQVKTYPMRRVYNIELQKGNAVRLSGPTGDVMAITLGNDLGLFPETDKLFGWGWREESNPYRWKYM